MKECNTPRAARRIALAVVASVVALLVAVGVAQAMRSVGHAPDHRAMVASLLSDPHTPRAHGATPAHRLTSPAGAPSRTAWLRGSARRVPRVSASPLAAAVGRFPDHDAVSARQMIARVARAAFVGSVGALGAGPTRAPPRLG